MAYDPINTFGYPAYPGLSTDDASPDSRRSPSFDSTPSTISSSTSLSTPPSSLRQYSTALKAMMAQGMSAAVADMNDDTREAERSFDKEFGYDDEDPIERHVRMNLTPCRAKSAPRHQKTMSYTEFMDMTRAKEEQQQMEVEEVLAHTPPAEEKTEQFRPGLIHFHRTHSSARRGIPSFGSSMDSESRSGSSTPFGDGTDTPGSEFSEASFEAIKPEDVISLYGKPMPSLPVQGYPFPRSVPSSDTFGPTTPLKQDRSSVISTSSTITSLSTATTISTATVVDLRQSRPSLLRPRPRASPYAGSYEGRQKANGVHLQPPDEEDAWMEGRTVSERMVLEAGVRCQRGRGLQS